MAVGSIFAYAAYRAIYYNVPPGAFFSFVVSLLMAYDPARRLAKLQVQMERAVVNASMIYELLDMETRQRDLPDAKQLTITEARIEFRDVTFGYANGKPVLDKVNFVAEGGKTTALVGPSGAGKSTVINLIPRFYDPAAGQIFIDGQDISHITKQSLRQHLAYVSQQPYLSRVQSATTSVTAGRNRPMPRSNRRHGLPTRTISSWRSLRATIRRSVKTA